MKIQGTSQVAECLWHVVEWTTQQHSFVPANRCHRNTIDASKKVPVHFFLYTISDTTWFNKTMENYHQSKQSCDFHQLQISHCLKYMRSVTAEIYTALKLKGNRQVLHRII